ncbi:uncharacterized protein SCHCODRAFT_02588218 [Schizophyllum commune H4-8]|nr:uncharacterized protein SCHCODRAFT_02588218 [Schizophyllum commune H4-8]KAI5888734.1 hypothetical protein SCHCODRAFT_02588218 [Schizophyllum commune H4-8]
MDRYIASCRASLAARIHDLPAELLEMVFLEVCSQQLDLPPVYHKRIRRNSCPALEISWVCSRWRAVALASTALWAPSRLVVDLGRYEKLMSRASPALVKEKCNNLLQCYLQRSGSRSIDAYILDKLRDVYTCEQTVGDIVDLVCSSISRWRLFVAPNYVVCRISAAVQTARPLLLRAARVSNDVMPDFDFDLDLDLSNVPKFNYWHGPLASVAGGKLSLPWQQLTHIDSDDYMSIGTFMQIMPLCQALVELRASISSNETSDPLPAKQAVSLPQLRDVSLTFEDYNILAYTFSVLTTQTLAVLSVFGSLREREYEPDYPPYTHRRSMVDLPHWPVDEFSGWLRRSGNSLKSLTIEGFSMPRRSLVDALELLPELTSLSLFLLTISDLLSPTYAIDDDMLLRMTACDGELPSLLPQLTDLEIRGIGASNEALAIAMIKSRRDPPFKDVLIHIMWRCISMKQDGELVVTGSR